MYVRAYPLLYSGYPARLCALYTGWFRKLSCFDQLFVVKTKCLDGFLPEIKEMRTTENHHSNWFNHNVERFICVDKLIEKLRTDGKFR